jgi:hypothetical protein
VLKRFGDPRTIGIDCVLQERPGVPARYSFGTVTLVVDGETIGNSDPSASEHIGIAIEVLSAVGRETGKRSDNALAKVPTELALDAVMWTVYGEVNSEFERMLPHPESLHIFEVLPYKTGPAFDGWEAILIESDETESFFWRRDNERRKCGSELSPREHSGARRKKQSCG